MLVPALRDRAGWRELVRRIARRTRRPDSAEDYLQAAFVRLEAYRGEAAVQNPDALLVRIATNVAIDDQRRERVRAVDARSALDLEQIASLQPLQDEVMVMRQRLDRVAAGLAKLNPRTREIFLMHRQEGLKYREIAARLGISVSAVEKHIASAALFLTEWTEGW